MEADNGTEGTTAPSMESAPGSGNPSGDVRSLVERGRERVRTSVDDGKARVARSLGTVAGSLKDGSRQLRDGEDAVVGGYVERVADQIDRAANYLERTDVDEIVGGVEQFARRNPAVFLGAAFAVGVLGARFLKASSPPDATGDAARGSAGGFGDREVPTTAIGAADLATESE